MSYELFNPQKHKVERREIALAFDRDGVREVTLADIKARYPEAEYPCAMRALLSGEHDIGWGERILNAPEDVAMCVVNGNALIREGFVPLLFDHGFTAKGTESPGDVLEFYEQGGDLWALVDLSDDEMYAKACKPGKRWKSRSLGFGAWIDEEGRIRPAQPKELSLTNLPRLKGLGKTVEMSHVRQLFAVGFGAGPAGLFVPTGPAVSLSAAPEGQLSAAANGGASLQTPTSSPVPASNGKEEHMKVSPETLKLLGLAPDASEDEFNRRVAEVAASAAPKPPAPQTPEAPAPAPAPAPVALSAADIERIVAEKTSAVFAAMSERHAKELADAEARAKKDARIDALLERAIRLGKVHRGLASLFRPGIEKDPDKFEAELAAMPTVAPVEQGIEGGGEPTTLGGNFYGHKSPRDYSRAIAETVATLGCPVSTAIDIVNAGGVNAGEEN